MNKIKLIMDTDIGSDIDDALCLAYVLRQPACELLGITTCSSEPAKRAEIADSICRYMGKDIPIYPGRDTPLIGQNSCRTARNSPKTTPLISCGR